MQKVLLKDLSAFAGNVLAMVWLHGQKPTATVMALQGELGAGKTTFVQALCKRLGITDTVQSPTYVLMKSYALKGELTTFGEKRRFNRVVHIDAYRLDSPQEFLALRPEEFLDDPRVLVLVEWPERLGEQLPKPDITITFSSEGAQEGERFVEVEN